MRARTVSPPTRSARIRKLPVVFNVPPVTTSPTPFSTGIGSPVIMDSSTAAPPSIKTPSTGIFPPGLTRSTAPAATADSGTSRSSPSSTMRAVCGARSRSERMALPVLARARSSSTWPSRTSTTIMAADSKYTAGFPPSAATGKTFGAKIATVL